MESLFVANWKLNKTIHETQEYFEELQAKLTGVELGGKKIVICPSYLSLPEASKMVNSLGLSVSIGGQDVSEYESGAYTGEVGAFQLKEFAQYVIIGHSERRRYFNETPDQIQRKIEMAKKQGLLTIVCIQDEYEIPEGADAIAFEPVGSIGTANPEDPGRITEVFKAVRSQTPEATLLYGGSVSPDTINQFKGIEHLSGFLIGGASLDPNSFVSIITAW